MKVSVIITNYNYERYVEAAIQSVLDQSYKDIEIIVVDDESKDNSREVIEKLASQYPQQIKTVFKQNQGQGKAIDSGVALVSGDIVAFMDSDDLWFSDKIFKVVAEFQDSQVVGVIHSLDTIDASGAILSGASIIPDIPNGDLGVILAETGAVWMYPSTSAISIRRSALDILLPTRAPEWRTSPDGCLLYSAAFLGKIIALHVPLGSYRNHGKNNYWEAEKPSIEKQQHMNRRIALTIDWINSFLEEIDNPARLQVKDNLNYRRALYYLSLRFSVSESIQISINILNWRFYNTREKFLFLGRFWAKNFQLIFSVNSEGGSKSSST